MLPLRRISWFFVLCLVFYGLLIAPWPPLMDGYRAFFRAGGNLVFHRFGSAGSVEFKPISSRDHAKDVTLRLTKHRVGSLERDITSVYAGYRPTAFLIALVLATPIPWSRRPWALLWGLILVNAFVTFRIGILLLNDFTNPNPLALFTLSHTLKSGLKFLVLLFFRAPEMHYIVPAFIWLLVTFRRGDLKTLLAKRERPGKARSA